MLMEGAQLHRLSSSTSRKWKPMSAGKTHQNSELVCLWSLHLLNSASLCHSLHDKDQPEDSEDRTGEI